MIKVFNSSDFYPQFLPPFPHLIHFVGLLRRFFALLALDEVFTQRIFVNSKFEIVGCDQKRFRKESSW